MSSEYIEYEVEKLSNNLNLQYPLFGTAWKNWKIISTYKIWKKKYEMKLEKKM